MGVVCIHAGLPYSDALRFCVPVFVAVWAFHYERGLARRERAWPYASQRFVQLLIPYAFWTSLYVLLLHPLSDWRTTPVHTIIGGWFGGYGWAGQYFFVILFQLTWLVPILRNLVTPVSMWVVVTAGVILNAIANYWLFDFRIVSGINDRLFVYWLPYVFLGVAFARGFPPSRRWLMLAAAALLAAPFEFEKLSALNQNMSVYLLTSVTIGSVALLLAAGPRFPHATFARESQASWGNHAVQYIGQNSFAIFVGHLLFLEAARYVGFVPDASVPGLVGRIMLVIMAIGGSLIIGRILRLTGLGILVGR